MRSIWVICALALPTSAQALTSETAKNPIGPTTNFDLRWSNTDIPQGRLVVLLDKEDISAQFQLLSNGHAQGNFDSMPLPVGNHGLSAFIVKDDNSWVPIGVLPLIVTHPAAKEFVPQLIVASKGLVDEKNSSSALGTRGRHADLTSQWSVRAQHQSGLWQTKAALDMVSSSYRPEVLNYSNQQSEAHKLDVGTYLLEAIRTNGLQQTHASLGHIQYGANPLLANGLSSRGARFSHKFNKHVDVGAAFLSGSPTVGAQNISGLNFHEDRFGALDIGIDALERMGALRLEAQLFGGTLNPHVLSRIQHPAGAHPFDTERSRGASLRLKSSSTDNALRADLIWSRSEHQPKGDSTSNTTPASSRAANASSAELAYDVLRNLSLSQQQSLNLGVVLRHERSSPSFKSLGAIQQSADYALNSLAVNSSLGVVSAQATVSTRKDNLNQSLVLLLNRVRSQSLTLSAPLGQLVNTQAPSPWWPTIGVTLSQNHSLADTAHIPTGQSLSQLPDMRVTTAGLNLAWAVNTWTVSYQLNRIAQNNQQLTQEAFDSRDLDHTLTSAWAITPSLNLTQTLSSKRGKQLASNALKQGRQLQSGVSWQFGDRNSLVITGSEAREMDPSNNMFTRVRQASLQFSKTSDFHLGKQKIPLQWGLNFGWNDNATASGSTRYQSLNFTLSAPLL